LYELLSTEEHKNLVDWPKVHIFFGDERCVEPTDPESNYRMADEAMLSRLPIPSYNVHRILGEGDAVANASLYEDDLRTFFDPAPFPNFDLVLLGMGPDGHTASLFPGTPALNEKKMWVLANWVDKLGSYRLTLTPPAINHASNIVFLVTGESKAERLREVLGPVRDPQRLPCQLIQPLTGSPLWFVDKQAGQKL
jgi:6-phosphogluconolactonase